MPAEPIEGMRDYGIANLDFKRVGGGLLVETLDTLGIDGDSSRWSRSAARRSRS